MLVKINTSRGSIPKNKKQLVIMDRGIADCIGFKSFNLQDVKQAVIEIFKVAQYESFPREYQTLSLSENLSKNSKMLSLNPILRGY